MNSVDLTAARDRFRPSKAHLLKFEENKIQFQQSFNICWHGPQVRQREDRLRGWNSLPWRDRTSSDAHMIVTNTAPILHPGLMAT
jgi:hypothetical protein